MINSDQNVRRYDALNVEQIGYIGSTSSAPLRPAFGPYQGRDTAAPLYIAEDQFHKGREFYGTVLGMLAAIAFSLAVWALIAWAWFKFT